MEDELIEEKFARNQKENQLKIHGLREEISRMK